jgi:hypothetical protein
LKVHWLKSNPAAADAADLQRHLRDAHVEKVLRQRTCPKCHSGTSSSGNFAAADDTHVPSDGGGQRHVGSFGRSNSADVGTVGGTIVEMGRLQVSRHSFVRLR